MTIKTEFKVYASIGNGMAWCVGTFDTESAAKRCANQEKGAAYVRKVTAETVYRNTRRGTDAVRPLRDVLERVRS